MFSQSLFRKILVAAVRAYPMVLSDLENDKKAEAHWEDKTVLGALFQAESIKDRDKYLKLFSVELRSDDE